MEIQEMLINEEKEAVIEDDEYEPSDIEDRPYKEWLESRFIKEWENGRKR